MDLDNIGKDLSNGLGRVARRVGDALYAPLAGSALHNAHNVYYHALQGEHFTPTVGVQGHFDPHSDEGQEIIDDARQKFRNAKATYLWLHRNDPGMAHPDEILTLKGIEGEQIPDSDPDGHQFHI